MAAEYSILDASNDFVSLSNSIGKFKEDLCKELILDFKSQDFRLTFLDMIHMIQQYLLSYFIHQSIRRTAE